MSIMKKRHIVISIILLTALILAGCAGAGKGKRLETLEDLNDPSVTIGAMTGSAQEPYVAKVFPKAEEKQFRTVNEMVIALDSGQIDAFVHSKSNIEAAMNEKPGEFRLIEEPVGETPVGMAVSPRTKYPELLSQVNEFLKDMKDSGDLDEMYQRWMGEDVPPMPDIPEVEDPVGMLSVGTSGELVPNSFYSDGELVGYDIELTKRFAYKYNYAVEFRPEGIDARISDTEFGRVDMLSGGVGETPERAEKVLFPDTPLYTQAISAVVRADRTRSGNFFENIAKSLEKTLVRENRWKMILSGLAVTLELSAGAFILGCALGFLFCMLRRSRNKALSAFMNGFISLIDGIPALLVLLICFYVIFSKMGLKEIPVAIIAFSITFGCRVANVLNTGLNSVDRGEIEAAEAMGLSPLQIFTKIQFPQAVTLTFGMFKTQTVTMIKNTSIVGYIAVMDLTKASDIIRARTYESFFSLVFTAVIYFLITRAALALLSQLGNRIDPRRRAKK